jgi:hypothetical protein
MGELFDMLKLVGGALRNRQRVIRLNDEADAIIKDVTGLTPAAFTKEFRDGLFKRLKSNYLTNEGLGAPYQARDFAAFKLLCYKDLPLPQPFPGELNRPLEI